MISNNISCKLNTDSIVHRFGTLQDIYIDNFSFRSSKQTDLSTGFTTNKVYKQRDKVVKIGDTVNHENNWYTSYKEKKHIPNVISYDGDKIILEYIQRNQDFNLDDVFDLIDTYKTYDKLNDLQFNSYIENIQKHLTKNPNITNGNKLLTRLHQINLTASFCHGDLSVMNLIPTVNGLKMIDPLYSQFKFGSYELDLAKLCFSFKFYKNDSASFNYIKEKAKIKYIDTLIASEAVRVASYKTEYSFIAENLINELI
jgi:tRNA A-37 threonylcarbamoyl transferase component Bud32